jgi:Uma2 family endonuclease
MRVMTERNTRIRHPDLVVTGSPAPPDDQVVPDPVLIIEVLSETTAGTDRGIKRVEYAALPSLTRYVMLAHDAPIAVVCDRADGFRERQEDTVLELPEFGVRLPLAELYASLLP